MIEIKDEQALSVLQKQFNFGFSKESDDLFTPGFAIKAKKGYGSTSFVIPNFPGSQLIFSYDGQSEVIKRELMKRDPEIENRVTVIDLYSPVFKQISNDDKALLEVGHSICDYVLKVLPLVSADHIVHERLSILNDRVEKYARYEHFGNYASSLTSPVVGQDLRMWGFRNRFYDQFVALTFAQSNICPVVTTYPAKDFGNAFKGQKSEDPDWEVNVMAHFRNVVDIKRIKDSKRPKGFTYYAILESMKGTDFGETGDEIDITGYKVIFPPEKFEKYRKGNPFNTVKSPVGPPHVVGDKSGEKDEDTAKENLEQVIEESKEDLLGDLI